MSEVFTLEKIYQAYLDCKERKKNTINALKFEMEREKNLISLLRELKSRRYEISRHICFIIKEPSPREIFAADFRDRVVHHLLYNEIYYLFEDDFIDNSFANRIGKGTHKGVEKLKEYLKEIDKSSYYLKLDIKSFFCSINKDILFKIVFEKINKANRPDYWKKEILWLCEKIIYHDPAKNYIFKGNWKMKLLIPKEKSLFYSNGKGLPIGNLTSQFFANVYLDRADYFIHSLGYKYYVRYVDDLIILGDKSIIFAIEKIKKFLKNNLDLKINDRKTKFQKINKGIDFLGYFIKPSHTLVRRKVVGRLKKKLMLCAGSNNIDRKGLKNILAKINSYYGHFRHASSFNLRRNIYDKHLGGLKNNFIPKKDYASLKLLTPVVEPR